MLMLVPGARRGSASHGLARRSGRRWPRFGAPPIGLAGVRRGSFKIAQLCPKTLPGRDFRTSESSDARFGLGYKSFGHNAPKDLCPKLLLSSESTGVPVHCNGLGLGASEFEVQATRSSRAAVCFQSNVSET